MSRPARGLTVLASLWLAAASAGAAEMRVESRPVEDLKAVFATVESVDQVMARTRIPGTVADLRVEEGDMVAAGQVIASIADAKLRLQIAAIDARVQALQAQEHQAALELDRARQLRLSGTGTQQRLEDAQAAVDVARAQIAAMKAERALVEQQQREGDVLAPTSGRVLQVKVVAGAVVMPGEPVASIATETYVLRLRLPERHARFMREGDPVLVGQRGLAPEREAAGLRQGKVRQVYPEMSGGQVVADAVVSGLGDFFVGERVRVLVATGSREAILVPPAYVIRRFGSDLVRLKDGSEVPVQLGGIIPAMGDRPGGIEILSGLRPGDVVLAPEGA